MNNINSSNSIKKLSISVAQGKFQKNTSSSQHMVDYAVHLLDLPECIGEKQTHWKFVLDSYLHNNLD